MSTETLIIGAFMLLVGGAAGVALAVWQRSGKSATTSDFTTMLAGVEGRLAQLSENVAQTSRGVNQGAQDTAVQLSQRLARIEDAAKRIELVGGGLRDVLQTPKLRGGLGEVMLETLLAQALPRDRFARQHTLRNGSVVDAIVKLPGGALSIDAKFPLEAYQRSLEGVDDSAKDAARREFVRSARARIIEIKERYIAPAETVDFALMYIPAESVYYGMAEDETLMAFARDAQVVPVSPNTLWLYLQTVMIGLRGMELQEHARRIRTDLAVIARDVDGFETDFVTLGRHIRNASNKYDEATRDLDKLSTDITRAARLPSATGQDADGEAVPLIEDADEPGG